MHDSSISLSFFAFRTLAFNICTNTFTLHPHPFYSEASSPTSSSAAPVWKPLFLFGGPSPSEELRPSVIPRYPHDLLRRKKGHTDYRVGEGHRKKERKKKESGEVFPMFLRLVCTCGKTFFKRSKGGIKLEYLEFFRGP